MQNRQPPSGAPSNLERRRLLDLAKAEYGEEQNRVAKPVRPRLSCRPHFAIVTP
jgi:hypothetical protein